MMLSCRLDYGFLWHILSQVNHPESIIFEHHCHQILADIMNIPGHRGNHHHGHLSIPLSGGKKGLQIFNGKLHGLCAGDQLGKEVFSSVKQLSHLVNCREQHLVEQALGFHSRLHCGFCVLFDLPSVPL